FPTVKAGVFTGASRVPACRASGSFFGIRHPSPCVVILLCDVRLLWLRRFGLFWRGRCRPKRLSLAATGLSNWSESIRTLLRLIPTTDLDLKIGLRFPGL